MGTPVSRVDPVAFVAGAAGAAVDGGGEAGAVELVGAEGGVEAGVAPVGGEVATTVALTTGLDGSMALSTRGM
ncbi:hypothetical protein ACHL6L_39700 [Amycolatopsis sp. A24]|uniref:hypothetical protein n=1 Tax=Amycolatopsis sp. A24 TaxID=3375097 RepID=UPI0039E96B13